MVQDLVPHDIGISVSYPLPGTLFYEKVKDQLLQKQNWTHSDDLDLMFEGEFGKAYYKRLHRLVHKLFRERQGLESLKSLVTAPLSGNHLKWRSALMILYYSPAALVDRVRLQWLAKR
jgi:anaerobic magnesium-protoporphyrin IX monomethyl ester cyclase